MFEPRMVVLKIDEFSEMEIRPKIGVSCRRLDGLQTKTNTMHAYTDGLCGVKGRANEPC
jgi:hypothetical protein